ncbi:pantetheine-phosphate adenylyltransferase [Quadrisphaera sp. DSM 44207]|uniref:pantetheine-phosphate adenylyltransferase n=1 Tax=Quadrisphaera sp. DSM 44207 TaxID=1881057 RepID=UPI00088318C7|nr:pantetheine-phosphate adenylyltransferase [Quadrisphaera sp. DSM 44207]SDQ75532.1 Phosphopantetheine adenylyltransferase [Quadrisphaera sp. DSM 44207]
MRRAVCPGSFDPVTLGHLDVVARAAVLFDEVVVAVLPNPAKRPAFELAERVAMVTEALAALPAPTRPAPQRVRVEAVTGGLLVDFCRRAGALAVVKGVRTAADVDHETPMALMNRHLSGLETVLLTADPRWAHVSSSLVKEVAGHGGDVSGLVPDAVLARLQALRAAPPAPSSASSSASSTRPATG